MERPSAFDYEPGCLLAPLLLFGDVWAVACAGIEQSITVPSKLCRDICAAFFRGEHSDGMLRPVLASEARVI